MFPINKFNYNNLYLISPSCALPYRMPLVHVSTVHTVSFDAEYILHIWVTHSHTIDIVINQFYYSNLRQCYFKW